MNILKHWAQRKISNERNFFYGVKMFINNDHPPVFSSVKYASASCRRTSRTRSRACCWSRPIPAPAWSTSELWQRASRSEHQASAHAATQITSWFVVLDCWPHEPSVKVMGLQVECRMNLGTELIIYLLRATNFETLCWSWPIDGYCARIYLIV